MHRRDRHVSLVLAAMLGLNVLTASFTVYSVWFYRRRFVAFAVAATESVKASEKASSEACASALLLSDLISSRGSSDESAPVALPRVVAYGQTRSKTARWIYADIDVGGVVHREYIQRLPFSP